MAKGDTFHKVSEFHKFPWDKLDLNKYGKSWDIDKGYIATICDPDDMYIKMVDKDLNMDVWVIPKPLRLIIERNAANAVVNLKRTLCELLGAEPKEDE